MITIQLKRTDDILSGISKLDYLLKISLFQKYKGEGGKRIEDIDDEKQTLTYRNLSGMTMRSADFASPDDLDIN